MKRVIAMVITLGLAFTLFLFPVNAAGVSVYGVKTGQWANNQGTMVTMTVTELYPPNDPVDSALPSEYDIVHKTLIVQLRLSNLSSETKYFTDLWPRFELSVPNTDNTGLVVYSACTDIVNYSPELMLTFSDQSGYIRYTQSQQFSFNGNPCVPPNTTLVALAKMEFACTIRSNTTTLSNMSYNECHVTGVSIYNSTYNSPSTDFTPNGSHQDINDALALLHTDLLNSGYGLPAIEETLEEMRDLLQDIHDNMGSQDYSDTITESNDLNTTEETIHQQELQWYSDNKTAIEATGLGNYQYSPGLIDSFGVARYQIAMLWNALGDWTYVYYLVFLLGLAVYILRHEPTMRVKQMRADREARMQENQIYTNASRNVRMSRDADYARHVAWGFRSRRK